LVKLAETAAEILKKRDSSPNGSDKSPRKRGAQAKADSEDKISERIGVPRQTINVAKQHVAAVTKYPELAAPGRAAEGRRKGRHFAPVGAGLRGMKRGDTYTSESFLGHPRAKCGGRLSLSARPPECHYMISRRRGLPAKTSARRENVHGVNPVKLPPGAAPLVDDPLYSVSHLRATE